MRYTLVGFSTELDWRPLNFVKPIPPNRVCAACGLVRKTTAFLPCTHVLCERCYEQCVQDGLHICPIDGHECRNEDAERRECPAEEMLRRQVTCLNEGSGCEKVMSVSEVCCHFHRECSHHSVRCPKCFAAVLCSNIWSHLRSNCSAQVQPLDPAEDPILFGCSDGKALLTSLRAAFKKRAADIRATLERMDVDIGGRLAEISSGMDTAKETLKGLPGQSRQDQSALADSIRGFTGSNAEVKERLSEKSDEIINLPNNTNRLEGTPKEETDKGTSKLQDRLTQTATAIEPEMTKNAQISADKLNEVLQHAKLYVTVCSFTVEGVNALREEALKEGKAVHYSETVSLHGFCIRPGVCLVNDGQSVKVRALLCVYKGAVDDSLRWPLGRKCRMSIIHPKHGATRELESKVDESKTHCQRPTSANREFCLPQKSFDLNSLINDGYVEDDQIRVQCELLA